MAEVDSYHHLRHLDGAADKSGVKGVRCERGQHRFIFKFDAAPLSLQDTSKYDSKQQSFGVSVSVGMGALIASTEQSVLDNKNRFQTASLSMSDIQNSAHYNAKSVGINIGSGVSFDGSLKPSGTSAGFGKDSGNASSTTQSGISGIAGNSNVRTGDAETGIQRIFDADRVQKEINAQTVITQTFGREAPKAAANFAASQALELRKQGNEEEAKKWDEGGAYRIALHTALGGLAGGLEGALGAGAVASAAPLLDELQKHIQAALKEAGAGDTLAKLGGQLVAQGTAAGIGASVGGTQGAATAFNTDTNNRQLHPSEYKFAKQYAKLVAGKLRISEQEAEGRIIAEILRNSDEQTAQAANGKHDYDIRGILGCQNLNCDGYKNDPNYANHNFNAQYIALNQIAYNLGQQQIGAGQTYNQLVVSNVKKDPVGVTLAGAGMVGLGVVTGGGLPTLGLMGTGGTIGMTVNGGVQATTGQPFDWVSFGVSGVTGAVSSGMGFWPVLLINTGGALTSSGVNGTNPNSAMAGAAVGTAIGYPIGAKVESSLGARLNPWYRDEWRSIGMGVSAYVPKSPIPSWVGGTGSSVVQEITGGATQNIVDRKK